jgi:hypothetical protein
VQRHPDRLQTSVRENNELSFGGFPARHSSGADMRQKTIDAIMAHAAEYTRECCGVVAKKPC